jgi:hypothetical protein
MTDQLAAFGVPDWLPPRVQRNLIAEAAQEAAAARRAERARDDRADQANDRALAAYRDAAEQREYVSAVALATGQQEAGRTLQEVFAGALEASNREDARAAVREARERQGDVPLFVGEGSIGRSGWPASEYELDRQLRRASDLHRDLVAYQARRNYPAAAEAARAKSAVTRSAYPSDDITRVCDADGMGQPSALRGGAIW